MREHTYAIFREFKSGKLAKKPIAVIEAVDEDEAWTRFSQTGRWGAYNQYTSFVLREVEPDKQ